MLPHVEGGRGTRRRLGPGAVLAALALVLAPGAHGQTPPVGSKATGGALPVPASVIKAATGYLGVPYLRGGDTRQGLDCSGLVFRVYHDILGMDLPRGVGALFAAGASAGSPLHVGDLLFFDTGSDAAISTPTHVGVYSGGGKFVHAASEGARAGVIVSALNNPYYSARFLGARRVFPWRAPVLSLTVTDEHTSIAETSPFASREPLAIDVYNGMTGGGPLDLSVLKDGKEVLAHRIVPGARKPAEVKLVPDVGSWTVRIKRIFRGRELSVLSFIVEE
jgi:hypothetical protein